MIILKTNLKIVLFFVTILFLSCSQQKNVPQKNTCKIYPDNLSKVSFSDNEQHITSIELDKFYNESNDFEILIYSYVEGIGDYRLLRSFKTSSGEWKQVKIENDKKTESKIEIPDDFVLDHLNTIEEKAFSQFCGLCYDCTYYTFLVKKNNIIFKYYSNSEPFFNLTEIENEKLVNYIRIYNFFNRIN